MDKVKKPNKVYEELKNRILYLQILPGASLSENEVATRSGVSRTPVRDAFRQLEAEGLIEVKSHIGTYVTLIDLNQITDAIFMREHLEKEIIKELADNPIHHRYGLKLVANLKAQKELIESDMTSFEFASAFMRLDNEFHALLFQLAGRESVWRYLEKGRNHYDRFRIFLNNDNREKIKKVYKEHELLIQYIQDKKVDEAFALYHEHLYYNIKNGTSAILENKHLFEGIE